jgi:hypothetical protein
MTVIQLVNQSKKINTTQLGNLCLGMQKYANLVAKAWGLQAVTVTSSPTKGAWMFFLVDQFPAGGPVNALGYHDFVNGQVVAYVSTAMTMPTLPAPLKITPWGVIIPGLGSTPETLMPGGFSEVLAHEIAEALVDPTVNRFAQDAHTGDLWLIEVGDQADAFRFTVTVGTLRKVRMIVQDFTLPSYYVAGSSGPWSYTGKVSAPYALDGNAYCYKVSGGIAHTVGYDRIGGGE